MTITPSRDEEIRLIWKESQWLYMVVGFIVGVLFCLLMWQSFLNVSELVQGLLPEAAGILITAGVIDQLNRRREKQNTVQQLKEELVRDASSTVNDVAKNAIHQLRKRNWLEGDNGLLARADLRGANLQGTELTTANLQRTDLSWANLQRTSLIHAKLQEADLHWANLQGASLIGAKLQGANLVGANLQEADLQWAKLQGASLVNAKLQGAKLTAANLERADLEEAKLQGANLEEAKLQEALLYEANLQKANLIRANLQGANLLWANLQGANLWLAKLQGANLGGVAFDEDTILPDRTHWTRDTDMTKFTQPKNEGGSK